MKKRVSVLMSLGLCVISLCITDLALARSQSLTTTIVINVIPIPKTNLAPNDNNAQIVNELAGDQEMSQPCIRLNTQVHGEQIYTITDKL